MFMMRLPEELQTVQERLKSCETRLHLISQAINSVVIDWDLTTNQFTRINSPHNLLGYGQDELATNLDSIRSGIHPDDLAHFDQSLQNWLRGQETELNLTVRSRHKDGSYRDLRGQALVVREPGTHRPLRVIASYSDITAERNALHALQRSEERYRLATDAIQGIVFDWNIPANTVYRSSGVQRMLGVSAEEVQPIPEWWQQRIHPDDRESTLTSVHEIMTQTSSHGTMTYRIRHRDGHYLHVHTNYLVIRNPAGQAERIVGCIVDQTPRIKAEEALRTAELNFHRLFHDIPLGLVVIDPADRLVECNQAFAQLMGTSLDQIVGQPVSVLPDESILKELLALKRTPENESGHHFWEKQLTRANGQQIPILLRGKLIPYQQQFQYCRFGILEDLTERKQAEMERHRLEVHLQEAQKLESLGVLAGGIAHDFNNLLTVILGNLSLMKQDVQPNTMQYQSLEHSEQASRQAAELCRQMLAYAGRGKLENRPLDLSELIEGSRALLSSAATKHHHLHYHLSTGLPWVAGDSSQIRQVILNLVQNAAEAIPQPAGTIEILTGVSSLDATQLKHCLFAGNHEPGQYVWLEVRDSGQGMHEEIRQRIFEPFFTTKFTGRGLGLAAVAGIVRTHRGIIQCESVPQSGTYFRVYFPIDPSIQRLIPVQAMEQKSEKKSLLTHGTILVVDDEPSVRMVLSRLLAKRGFAVIEAENGNEALEMVARHADALRLIILDLTMPQRDGLSTLQELRKQHISTPVVLISGYYANELMPQFEQLQAQYISKPFTAQNLLAVIEPILSE